MSDTLASPTLALVYLAQGHDQRARETLVEVLSREPANGHALALWARLEAPILGTLELERLAGGELELRWSVSESELAAGVQVVLATMSARGDLGLLYTSVACAGTRGATRRTLPPGPGSAAAALVVPSQEGGDPRFLVVGERASW